MPYIIFYVAVFLGMFSLLLYICHCHAYTQFAIADVVVIVFVCFVSILSFVVNSVLCVGGKVVSIHQETVPDGFPINAISSGKCGTNDLVLEHG